MTSNYEVKYSYPGTQRLRSPLLVPYTRPWPALGSHRAEFPLTWLRTSELHTCITSFTCWQRRTYVVRGVEIILVQYYVFHMETRTYTVHLFLIIFVQYYVFHMGKENKRCTWIWNYFIANFKIKANKITMRINSSTSYI